MNVTIPNGCEAQIILPNNETYSVKGGKYSYECQLGKNIYSPFSIDTPIIDLIKNEDAYRILKENLPQIFKSIKDKNEGFEVNSISSANLLPNLASPPDTIKKVNEELSKIKP